jgi:hypothetical protein
VYIGEVYAKKRQISPSLPYLGRRDTDRVISQSTLVISIGQGHRNLIPIKCLFLLVYLPLNIIGTSDKSALFVYEQGILTKEEWRRTINLIFMGNLF